MAPSSLSRELISRRDDLRRLVDDGYRIEIRAGYVILHHVPYVTSSRTIQFGQLMCPITDGPPTDHTMHFAGEYPCDDLGVPIEALRNSSGRTELAEGLWADHYFSAKPATGAYEDYHHKMTHYEHVIGRCARRIDPTAVAREGQLIMQPDENDPFVFMETASSRAGIVRQNERLANDKVGIVGLGGTGAHILDYVSKARVAEIHLFDGDLFQQHNAFRSPGPTDPQEIGGRQTKVHVYADRYSRMRRGIVPHPNHLEPGNVDELRALDFVFVAVDRNDVRAWLLPALSEMRVPFVDVGMGIEEADGKLLGIIRTTFNEARPSSVARSGTPVAEGANEYQRNIQIAELNALNAALAVIRWKKHREFYLDLGGEAGSAYTLDGNHMSNRPVGAAGDA